MRRLSMLVVLAAVGCKQPQVGILDTAPRDTVPRGVGLGAARSHDGMPGTRSASSAGERVTARALASPRERQRNALKYEPARLSRRLNRSLRSNAGARSSTERHQTAQAASRLESGDPFRALGECLRLVLAGERVEREPETARIASWNVRWFPDGVPGNPSSSAQSTDLEWLACTLAYLNVDAVALAEVKSPPYSAVALDRLTTRLDELTGGRHRVRMDDCPDTNPQHVAWLVNERTVSVSDWQMHASLNPNGEACAGQLRPGLGARFRFPGGLDLHAVAVHLKSGVQLRDLELRRGSFDAFERVLYAATRASGDDDVLIAGDFNTMGCRDCSDPTRSAAEASWLDSRLRACRPEARRVPSDIGCSHYYQRQPSLLDHFVVTSAMREAAVANRATVYGYCRELGCEGLVGSEPESVRRLSDHCPVVLALADHDWD